MAQCHGLHALVVKLFFGLHLSACTIFSVAKIPKLRGTSHNVNLPQTITWLLWLVGVTVPSTGMSIFQPNNFPPPLQFLCDICFSEDNKL